MAHEFQRAIFWFRRDLRLTDNTGLNAARAAAEEVIPAYVVSDWSGRHAWTGAPRQAFLCGCLESLARNLEAFGGKLIFRRGQAVEALVGLARETGAEAIFFNRDYDPFGRETEKALARRAAELGLQTRGFKDRVLHEPDEVLTQNGAPYRVYTPYARNWRALDKPSPGKSAKSFQTPPKIESVSCPTLKTWKLAAPDADFVTPGEAAARKRLKAAFSGPLPHYGERRDTPFGQTTSRLSQDLRFGLLSIREIYRRAIDSGERAETAAVRENLGKFVAELAWREFYLAVLAHWPEVLETEFNPQWRGLPWEEPGEQFQRWCEGRTGFPIVDAGMRELNATGFMHNRVRMIVAMFATKDLHVNWREGEKIFMQRLIDGEIASNNGGWQWSAGVGADAAPYFRIQNPWTQTKRYDPDGAYIRRWIPELKNVEARQLFTEPKPGNSVAAGYPQPIVNHREERERCLEIFGNWKG